MKNKTTAALLAFFFGPLGVHRFYLGQVGLGFLYIVFFFVSWLISLIDFIVFLTMDDATFNQKYNAGIAPQYLQPTHPSPPRMTTPTVAPINRDLAEELQKLHALKEKGILTEEEFQARKAKLLQR